MSDNGNRESMFSGLEDSFFRSFLLKNLSKNLLQNFFMKLSKRETTVMSVSIFIQLV